MFNVLFNILMVCTWLCRGVARYLKTLFDEESGPGRKSVAIDHLVRGKTRKEASRMFFETLVC
jgi:cohesin complex subunit SCC1